MLKKFSEEKGGWKIATHHSSLMPEKVPESPTLKRQSSPAQSPPLDSLGPPKKKSKLRNKSGDNADKLPAASPTEAIN